MLPVPIIRLLLILVGASLSILVLIPALIGYWRLAHGSLLRSSSLHLSDVLVMFLALVLINGFCYILGNGGSHPFPADTLRMVLLCLDIPFLLFLLDAVVVALLTRKARVPVAKGELRSSGSGDSTLS